MPSISPLKLLAIGQCLFLAAALPLSLSAASLPDAALNLKLQAPIETKHKQAQSAVCQHLALSWEPLKGGLPKSPVYFKAGRGVPTAPQEFDRIGTCWTIADGHGAVGTPRPACDGLGQHALNPSPRSLLNFQQRSAPRREPHVLTFERSQPAAVSGHMLYPARRRAELRRAGA